MRIGIFGGAFNPVHKGHLNLLELLVRINNIDKLLVIPTADPPHKSDEDFADAQDRFNMLEMALNNKDNFNFDVTDRIEISDIEFKLKGKSYTYNTLKALKQIYPFDSFFLFMGSDQFLNFTKWYKYKKILKLTNVIGLIREEGEADVLRQYMIDNKDIFPENRVGVVVTKPMVVSSTDIREKVKKGESIAELVPKEVEEYILKKGLYRV
ncbi:MAG: nicotinate (nicotinamide) nucleotide adenylyltransferase [Acetobacter sp.]|nr:nicotinate (nicotinamide) nucleotide adenylyltransferase [Bacteroides sp.]MCM1340720.1 nicotinate (nicotinamide) nucleotide adenylyltransferase [Acetobacter sp.]MCM1433058.1 nicotinate (nicotinamide) nucleotide adenylyltransferase [Clostridiales bacterium]